MKAKNLNEPAAPIVVMNGPPPAEKIGKGLREDTSMVINRALELQPGQWFEWPSPPTSWKVLAKKYLGEAPVVVYPTPDKRVVVRHKATGPVAAPSQNGQAQPGQDQRSDAARAADARAARAAAPVTPQRVGISGEDAPPGSVRPWVSLGQGARLMLKKLKQLAPVPVTMSDLRDAMGVRTGHVEMVAELKELGYATVTERADGRKAWAITTEGEVALLAIMQGERA